MIPAYNEATTIGEVVRMASGHGSPIVIDDGSSDGTAELASSAGARVVSHTANAGYDAALNSGFAAASASGCDYVLTMDADGQHNPTILPLFIKALAEGADVVIGVRDRRQRFAEHVFARLSKIFWGIDDPLCGLKGYRIEVYKELGHFDVYNSIGTELAIYAARQRKKIAQIPVTTRDRVGAPRFGHRLSANMKIFRALGYALFCRASLSMVSGRARG